MVDPFTAASPTYRAAARQGADPLPLAFGEVAELESLPGWRRRRGRHVRRTFARALARAGAVFLITAAALVCLAFVGAALNP